MADEQDLFERIWYAARDGRVDIGVDLKALNKPASPVFSMSDMLLPWLATICIAIVGWRLAGWIGAAVALSSMLVLLATTINFVVMRRLRKRSVDYALSGRPGFEELWRFGGLSLRLKGDPASEVNAPDDDWQGFARRRLPKTEAETEG